jgi:hypothetical protein
MGAWLVCGVDGVEFRELFVNLLDSTSPPADKKGPFHIHKTVSVRVWEEILVRCWVSHMPIRALLNRVRSRGLVTEVAQEQFRG